jgi:hypothetical protein
MQGHPDIATLVWVVSNRVMKISPSLSSPCSCQHRPPPAPQSKRFRTSPQWAATKGCARSTRTGKHQGTGRDVRNIMMSARAVVYAVASTTRDSPLARDQLRGEPLQVQKLHSCHVDSNYASRELAWSIDVGGWLESAWGQWSVAGYY